MRLLGIPGAEEGYDEYRPLREAGIVGYALPPPDLGCLSWEMVIRPQVILQPYHLLLDVDDDEDPADRTRLGRMLVGMDLQIGIDLAARAFAWELCLWHLDDSPTFQGAIVTAVDAGGVDAIAPGWRAAPRLVIDRVQPGQDIAITLQRRGGGVRFHGGLLIGAVMSLLVACSSPAGAPDAGDVDAAPPLQACDVVCGDTEYTCDVDGCRCSSPFTPPTPCAGSCTVQLGGTP